jgi:hypothetical protein
LAGDPGWKRRFAAGVEDRLEEPFFRSLIIYSLCRDNL